MCDFRETEITVVRAGDDKAWMTGLSVEMEKKGYIFEK